ncbi:MAG: hypothetical protein HYT94_01745 [Parcubacteria group bacterium]|nr:hypothetical protein [Parcubacteria group bacterium]
MKKFTCREIMNGAGGCDMVFEGAEMMDVASQCGKHVADTTDDLHKPMRDMMAANHSEEEKKKWFMWFQGEWDKKAE